MYYYLKDTGMVRQLTASDAARWLQVWAGYDNTIALPSIEDEFICWSRPFHKHIKIYVFGRVLDTAELLDL